MIVIEQSQIGGMNQVYVILFHIKVLNYCNHAKKVLQGGDRNFQTTINFRQYGLAVL